MTVAVCSNCGNFKHGAFTSCEACRFQPADAKELALATAISDHYFSNEALAEISLEIKAGRLPIIDPKLVSELESTYLNSPILQMMKSGKTASVKALNPVNLSYESRRAELAKRIIQIESRTAGRVKCRQNAMLVGESLAELKTLGYKKPFMANGTQFLYDTVLTHRAALTHMLQFMVLARENEDYSYTIWAGKTGRCVGSCSFISLASFTPFPGIVMTILITPFFGEVMDLLDPETPK